MNSKQRNILLMFAFLGYFPLAAKAQNTSNRPNIIVFMVDDMGWQDTSVPFWNKKTEFNKRYRTPHMERLARQGMKFTNAYATPICTPTRVSLITGVTAAKTQVTQWTHPNKNRNTDHPDRVFKSVPWNMNGFSPVAGVENTYYATALPQVLKDHGYYTIHSGKAHFGSAGTPAANPLNIGFEVNIAGSEIGHPASYLGEKNYDNPKDGQPNRNAVPGLEKYHGTDTFLSDAITYEALEALKKPIESKQPFFLYLSHYAIHSPINTDKRYIDHYLKEGMNPTEASYATLIEGMDKSLGDVMDFLDREKLSDNTLIIFMSDNGGLSLTPPRGGAEWSHNLPLKGGKGSVYEGGIREPMIVRWPGKIKPNSTAQQYVIIDDFMPTILEVAGIEKPSLVQTMTGRSFLPILQKPSFRDDKRELLWHHPNRWTIKDTLSINWASAYRQGDWKMIYDYRAGRLELYNLKKDIGEQHDLAGSNTKKAKAMAKNFTSKLKEYQAQMPYFLETGKVVPWPDELLSR
ncbi:arylsulfatase A-like enzyme [Dyadobacter jejuensis]|uniref:Arylsulfatase A-like enzyme n=1 Tax=Dyadobacter jejuensis TaxID=1082580 RepID=A0A316A801_9BACT|nr:sulfatase [Dyadobacter jejuensis]PWJ53368.1 arylsulfatase A-like enzyme [Dyadobacter jejuensis]